MLSGRTPIGVLLMVALVAVLVVCAPSYVYAFPEPNTMGSSSCAACHDMHGPSIFSAAAGDCATCHASSNSVGYAAEESSGPHDGYLTTTRKCAVCHSVHAAPEDGIKLLAGATIVDTCFTCHDGTGGWGVYGTILARTGVDPKTDLSLGSHRVGVTDVIPGGDKDAGGDSTRTFRDTSGLLICTDCHSPHSADVVNAFSGERARIRGFGNTGDVLQTHPPTPLSTKLLRRTPTGATSPVDDYGSAWCLGCHEGRSSGGTVHNHPVEMTYVYDSLPILDSSTVTWGTVLGGLGDTSPGISSTVDGIHEPNSFEYGNRGYLMPYPRTTGLNGQDGHYPICQQCHEDSRDVGDLAANGSADVVPFSIVYADSVSWNGSAWVTTTVDNPRFQNFPHETQNDRMLVEVNDDLCLNCHPQGQLP